MGSMRVSDETIEWPDIDDDTVAAALKQSSNVAGNTTAEIIANWPIHEAKSYMKSVEGWIADKVAKDSLGTAIEDAQTAKDAALPAIEESVIIKKVVAVPDKA